MNAEKRLVKTIATRINERVNFKFFPEDFEQIIIEGVVSRLLDFTVETLNISTDTLATAAEIAELSVDGLESNEFRDKLITHVNKVINLPILSEEKEFELLKAFFNVLVPLVSKGNSTKLLGK